MWLWELLGCGHGGSWRVVFPGRPWTLRPASTSVLLFIAHVSSTLAFLGCNPYKKLERLVRCFSVFCEPSSNPQCAGKPDHSVETSGPSTRAAGSGISAVLWGEPSDPWGPTRSPASFRMWTVGHPVSAQRIRECLDVRKLTLWCCKWTPMQSVLPVEIYSSPPGPGTSDQILFRVLDTVLKQSEIFKSNLTVKKRPTHLIFSYFFLPINLKLIVSELQTWINFDLKSNIIIL